MTIELSRLGRIKPTRFSIDSSFNMMIGRNIITVVLMDHRRNKPHTGTAVCHPGDKFSREYGERLALKRAYSDWVMANLDEVIDYALTMDISMQEAIKLLWKHLGAHIYETYKELTDGNHEPASV
jgi:hypothetical protein